MLDTVEGYIPKEELFSEEQIEQFKNTCESLEQVYFSKTKTYTTRLSKRELEFSISENNIRFKNLSLPNYLHGTNSNNFKFDEVKTALNKLENEFNLPFSRAYITRVDIAWNFPVSKPTIEYLNCLAAHPRFTGITKHKNSKKFLQGSRAKEMIFYDKIIERVDKNKPINLDEPSENLLRYELRFLKSPHKHLKLPELTFKDLTKAYIQRLLLTEWYNYYRLTEKVDESLIYELKPQKTAKKLQEYIVGYTLNSLPNFYSTVSNNINTWYSSSMINRSQRDQMKRKLKSSLSNFQELEQPIYNYTNKSLVEELNSLVYNYFKEVNMGYKI